MATAGRIYSNTMKFHNKISYCYSSIYDVDHIGWQCQLNKIKITHIPNVVRDEAHTIADASMKAQHKNLPDGYGADNGWILTQQLRKENWIMDQQDKWKQQHQQQHQKQQWRG